MIDSNLRDTPLFSALDEEAATALKQSMVPQSIKKGQDLFKEGDPGDRRGRRRSDRERARRHPRGAQDQLGHRRGVGKGPWALKPA